MPGDSVLHVSTTPVTLYYDAMGTCHTAVSGGSTVDECEFTYAGQRVQILLVPISSGLPPLERGQTRVTETSGTPANAYSWEPERGVDVTLTFDVPTGSGTYGWDFAGFSFPTPLVIKVRVKRPT